MTTTETITIRIDPEIKARIAKMAEIEDRSISYISAKVLKDYIDHIEEMKRYVQEGIDAADRGELRNHGDVVREYEQRKKKYLAQNVSDQVDSDG